MHINKKAIGTETLIKIILWIILGAIVGLAIVTLLKNLGVI